MSRLISKVNASERIASLPMNLDRTVPVDMTASVVLCTPAAAAAGLGAVAAGVGLGEAGAQLADAID